MDQRVKGEPPPTTNSALDPAPAPKDSGQDQVAEKKSRGNGENGEVGGKEEKKGAGKKREGHKGAVLELLIEGRCGSAGQQQLQISGKETSCPEGNVRLRIGLQAKRTKKPPKILESYVCKPTIRTYQRQGRGALLRVDGDGGVGQQSKNNSATDKSTRDQCSGLDSVQPASKQTASAASQPFASSSTSSSSSSSQPPLSSSTLAAVSTAASVPGVNNQGTKSAKLVPVKLADKGEVNSSGSSDRAKKEKLPSVNGQPEPAGQKSCAPAADQTTSASPSASCVQSLPASETRNEGNTSKKHNGLVQTTKKKGQSNGKGSVGMLGTTPSSKIKAGKHSSSSSVDSSTRPPVSTSTNKELGMSSKSRPGSPCSPSVDPKPQLSPTADLSSVQFKDLDPFLQASLEKKKEKERRAKKEKLRDKKSKRNTLEAERAHGEIRKEDGVKKKKEKRKDGKSQHGKDRSERHKTDDMRREELKTDRGNTEKRRERLSPDRAEDIHAKCGETVVSAKLDRSSKALNPGTPDEIVKADDSCKPVKEADPATGDISKSKEQDLTRHLTVPPSHPSLAPPSVSTPSVRTLVSPPGSPHEQDSRPLKKRKARRPSWTKLVQRAQRAENHEASLDAQHKTPSSFSQNPKASIPAKASFHQTDESHHSSSRFLTSSSSPPLSSTASPKQSHQTSASSFTASRCPITPARKRGRPKSYSSSFDEPPPRLSPNAIPNEVSHLEYEGTRKAPVLEPSQILQSTAQPKVGPKKRGRPPKRPIPEDRSDGTDRGKNPRPPEKGDRQLKIRRLINEMKKRKKRRLHKVMLSGYMGKEGRGGQATDGELSLRMHKTLEATTVHSLTALSSSFGSKLGPQINVSKRGTIYMGKRRGRKPKAQTSPVAQNNSQNASQSSLFTSPSEIPLFSTQSHPPPSHPFPSPSLTHSSGAQSPYSEGSLTEPTPSLLFTHPFSLPSPSSSCTSPRPPSSSSLSLFVKKSCPCQGRHHFPFHQSSCKLFCPTPPLHHTPGSPGHPKDATPSPRSESHSEETLPSDSGIGTDNNSVSERGEIRAARSIHRLGQGSGLILGGQKHPSSLVDHPSSASSPLCRMPRHANPISNPATAERHRDRHRHRRRDYDCSTSCACLCQCPFPGHNKCTHSEYYSCLGHNTVKRQKNKHKKKHQQLHMQDPEFLADLEDVISQLSEIHIGRRSWARAGLEQNLDGSGNTPGGGRRHHSSHSLRSNIFRINLNGFYSPHPSSYSANTYFSPQPFYPCQPVHCNRKPDRRQCGCPSKFQETIENMGFYNTSPPATALYHHLPGSFSLPSPHQYAPHQPHHAHFIINPARFHRRRNRLLREGALGGEVDGDMEGGGGGLHLGSGFTSSLSCGCGRNEHKPKHKHRHRHCERDLDDDEELHEDDEEDGMESEGLASAKSRSGFMVAQGEAGRKAARGMGSMLSRESPWLCEKGNNSFASAAAAAAAVKSSSSSLPADRYKHTALTSLGLGSTHLSSFGGGWGGLGQSWTKFGGLGGTGFQNSNPSFRGFNGEQHASQLTASEGEEDDDEDVPDAPLYKTPQPQTHTNLFTSAAMEKGGRGLRSRLVGRNPGSADRSWRTEEPAWTERREAGLQGDWRSRGQQKSAPTQHGAGEVNKRRPGRPRKHPLPCAASSPTHPSAAPSVSSPDLLPGHSHNRDGREVGGRKDERGPERDPGVDTAQQVAESELQARKKRGRKRKHGDSPCHQSVTEDEPECDTGAECFSPSDTEQAPSQPVAIQREERADGPPRKKFLRAGLYSDDYKTTDPPTQAQQLCRDSMEYTPGERDYSLLPAPIHVGKYLRLKRIHFQLPYDVMWLWQHNQLHRPPSVPLKRKRRYCRLKERSTSSHQTAERSSDITSLFPHLNMEPLTSSERSFVLKHHVFLVRNWELVRDKQIRLRIERERDEEGEERALRRPSCDGSVGDDGHIKSDQPKGVEVALNCGDAHHRSQDMPSSLTASPRPATTQNGEEEEGEEETRGGEEEACSREQRRKRLNDLLLTLQHS